MNEDGLRSIIYDFVDRTATLIYEPNSEYDIEAIKKYVGDMSDGKAVCINIFEGNEHFHGLRCSADGLWSTGIAPRQKNGL